MINTSCVQNPFFAGMLLAVFFISLMLLPRSAFAVNDITLSSLFATSTNATTTFATTGNAVRFQLNLSGTPLIAPTINILNMGTTSFSGTGANWTYSTTTPSSWSQGAVTFYAAFGSTDGVNSHGTTTVSQANLSGANVVFDNVVPTLSAVTMFSSNASTTLALVGDTITLTATSSEGISTATVTIGGHSTTFTNNANTGATASTTWKGTYVVHTGDTGGNQAFTADFSDYAGNAGTQVTAISSGVPVFVDTAGPVITITGSNPDTVYALNGSSYTDPGATATDAHDGTRTVTVSGTVDRSITGSYTLTYSSTDTAGNTTTATRTVTVTAPGSGGPIVGLIGNANPNINAYIHANDNASFKRNLELGTTSAAITNLQLQINTLLAQIAASTGGAPNVNAYAHANGNASFKRNLTAGAVGDDVQALQAWLNAHGFSVAGSGAGSSGHETIKFGSLTKKALAKWQASVGISPAVGYFGPKTRAYMAAH